MSENSKDNQDRASQEGEDKKDQETKINLPCKKYISKQSSQTHNAWLKAINSRPFYGGRPRKVHSRQSHPI